MRLFLLYHRLTVSIAIKPMQRSGRYEKRRGERSGQELLLFYVDQVPVSLSVHDETLQRGQRQIHQVKLRLGLQVEDKQFQQMINETGVGLA